MGRARTRRLSKGHRRRSRRQPRPLLLAGGGGVALAVAISFFLSAFTNIDVVGAAAAQAQSIADIMRQRSPGERTEAQLMKTKGKYQVLAERELPELPQLAVYTPPVELFAPPLQPAIFVPPALPVLAAAPPLSPFFFKPPVGGVFAPPPPGGGGPGGPGGPPGQPPPPGPPQIPSVPEPGTWAMMILGFGLSGWTLRRHRAKASQLLDA